MDKIQNFPLTLLPNGLHLQLATDWGVEVNRYGAGELGLGNQIGPFITAKDAEAAAMRVEQGNALTGTLFDYDTQRDNTMWGISTRIDSSLLSPIAAEVASAKVLKRIMEKYGDVRAHEYNTESAELNLMLTDLQLAANAPHLQALGLTSWVAALKTQNDLFQTTYNKRDGENSARVSGNTRAVRRPVDAAYRTMVDIVNATVVLGQAKPVAFQLIKEWNVKLDRYRTLINPSDDAKPADGQPKA